MQFSRGKLIHIQKFIKAERFTFFFIIEQNHKRNMEAEEIQQLLEEQNEQIIDTDAPKATDNDEEHSIMNLAQIWTHSLLYLKNIYPQELFCQRNILGATTYVAEAEPLKEYLDQFFQKLEIHLEHMNNLQILIVSTDQQIIERNTLHINNFGESRIIDENEEKLMEKENKTQRNIEIKAFIEELNERLKEGFVRSMEDVSFRFRIGYRLQEGREDKEDNGLNEQKEDKKDIEDKSVNEEKKDKDDKKENDDKEKQEKEENEENDDKEEKEHKYDKGKRDNSSNIVQDWVKREPSNTSGKILLSLKGHYLNLLYQQAQT